MVPVLSWKERVETSVLCNPKVEEAIGTTDMSSVGSEGSYGTGGDDREHSEMEG